MTDVNFNDLFGNNFTAADALSATESKKNTSFSNPDIYKPSIKDEKCRDMNYRAVVRFIPFYNEGKWNTTINRWETYLKDVNGENGIFVVSPKTVGKKCPIRTMSWNLHESDSALDKANSEKIRVYQQFYALVEVVKDAQHPEYNGKIFIYQFGKKIYDKIETAMHSSEYSDGINPFALYDGKLFEINLTKGDQKMDNGTVVASYDACRFLDKTAPIHFGDGQTLSADDRESQKAFFNWLENDAPKIKEYLYKEWDAETTEKVNSILATYKSGYVAPRSPKAAAQEAVNIVSESPISSPKPATVASAPVEDMPDFTAGETQVSTDDNDDWVNNILNS